MTATPPNHPQPQDAQANSPTAPSAPTSLKAAPNEDSDYTWGGFFLFLAQRVFLYFALYTLSIGPLYWQWYQSRFIGGSSLIAAFYEPLNMLAQWIPPFGRWVDWYVDLWIA